MSDGTENLDPQPNERPPVTESLAETPADAQVDLGEGQAPVIEDDSEEIDFDGEKYKVPKKLKDSFLMHGDYTRKTQEVARQREAIEARAAEVTREAEARKGLEKEIGRLTLIDEQLEQYQKVDWAALRAANPEQANTHFQDYALLRDQRENLAAKVQRDVQERSQKAQLEHAKRYAEANEVLARDIKGWNQELADNLRNFALASGISATELRELATNVTQVKLLHKAYLGEQLSTAKSPAPIMPKVEAKPIAKVGGAGPRIVNVHDPNLDMEKYVEARRKQGFGKR
jgi:hypothetical protein